MNPTIGRSVYYKYNSKDRPAVITDVHIGDGECCDKVEVKLCVFNPEVGVTFTPWLAQGQEEGRWDWMPYQKAQADSQPTQEDDGEEDDEKDV